MLDGFDVRASVPELREYHIYLTGAGSSDPTVRYAPGVTVARSDTGDYTITWTDSPGVFLGWSWALGADTLSDVAGHTLTRGAYNSSAYTLAITLTNASDAAHDLATAEYMDIIVRFKQTAV